MIVEPCPQNPLCDSTHKNASYMILPSCSLIYGTLHSRIPETLSIYKLIHEFCANTSDENLQLLDYTVHNFSERRHHRALNTFKTFFTLSLIKLKEKNLCNTILGILVELSDNPKTVLHMSVWRGRRDQTAANLLIQLWRQEELDLGIRRDQYGMIIGKFYDTSGTVSSPVK